MKISIIVLFFTLLSFQEVQAQSASSALFLEGGGVAPFYSVNYSRVLFQVENLAASVRIGAGIWKEGVAFPVGVTLLVGNSNHRLEITPAVGLHFEGTPFWDREKSDFLFDLVLGIGYRFQPQDRSFFLSAGVFPFLQFDPTEATFSEKKAKLGVRPGLSIGKLF